MEKLPFPGEGFHIENRRLGSLFEDRRIRQKKNPKKKNPKKTQKKNPYTYTIQAHICLYRDIGTYVPVSQLSDAGAITIQAHFFGVPGVCLYRVFTVRCNVLHATFPSHIAGVSNLRLRAPGLESAQSEGENKPLWIGQYWTGGW